MSARLMKRVGDFLGDFIRKHYGFLAPCQVEELRAFRTEVEDKYYPCHVRINPFPPHEIIPPPTRGAPKKKKAEVSSDSSVASYESVKKKTTSKPSSRRSDSISSISDLESVAIDKLVSMYKEDSSVSSVLPSRIKRERSLSDDYKPYKKTKTASKRKSDSPVKLRKRIEVAPERVTVVTDMLSPGGPGQHTFEDGVIIRKALDWNKNTIPGLLVTDAGEFYVKTVHATLGPMIYQSTMTKKDKYIFCNAQRYKCAAVVVRTFVKLEDVYPLHYYIFQNRNGDNLDFSVDNIILKDNTRIARV